MTIADQGSSSVLAWRPEGRARLSLSVADIPSPAANIVTRPAGPKRRAQIRELHHSLHCSIVGTCLSTGEFRRLFVRLNMKSAEGVDDHGLHQMGVMLASGPNVGAKQLQKLLDRKYKLAIAHFGKARNGAA